MSETIPPENGGARRRSMLPTPQRMIPKPTIGPRLPALGEDGTADTAVTRSKTRQSLKPMDVLNAGTTSMPPASAIGRPMSTRGSLPHTQQASKPASNPSSRSSSLARPVELNAFKTPARPAAHVDSKKAVSAAQSSMHRRSMSQQIGQTAKTNVSLPSRTPSLRQSSMRVPKPAFSAMQQHYSPQKKPIASGPEEEAESKFDPSEISNLQRELAQLHMMHRSAASVQQQWEQSARQSFETRFNDLCMKHVELKEIAHEQRTILNQLALVEWCQGIPSTHIAEKVQQVSRNIADIRSLLEPEGKYTRVLGVFESWFARARKIELERSDDAVKKTRRDLAFIEGIGDGWKAEAMVLERELTYCLRELKEFGEIRAVSSLGRILSLHKTLVSNLLEELDVIQWIENEIMVHEGAWMEQTIEKLSSNASNPI